MKIEESSDAESAGKLPGTFTIGCLNGILPQSTDTWKSPMFFRPLCLSLSPYLDKGGN
jgi:hypothetical protein